MTSNPKYQASTIFETGTSDLWMKIILLLTKKCKSEFSFFKLFAKEIPVNKLI